MDRGLFISYTYGYFAKHWVDYLSSKGFEHFILDHLNQKKNFELIEGANKLQKYKYLLITTSHMPLSVGHLSRLSIPQKILFLTDDDWQFRIVSRYYGQYFDWIITTYKSNLPLYRNVSPNIILSQYGCNQMLFRPQNVSKSIDVSLIGRPHGDRVEMLSFLVDEGFDVKIYGTGWKEVDKLKKYWGGYLSTQDLVTVINQSKININPALSGTRSGLQLKGRTFEIAGCRSFQLTENNPYLYDYFEKDEEIVTFDNYEDLANKIRYFIKKEKEREEISYRAFERVMRDHTWDKRLDEIFSFIEGIKTTRQTLPHISASSINLIYIADGHGRLNPNTIRSINSQTVKNVTVYLIGDNKNSVCIRFPVKTGFTLSTVFNEIQGDYCAFIQDGDFWEPEKLQMQSYALDMDSSDGIKVNLLNYGVFIDDPMEEEIIYSFRDNGKLLKFEEPNYLIVPSCIMVASDIVKNCQNDFNIFCHFGFMNQIFQKRLDVTDGRHSIVDFEYSLARVHIDIVKRKAVKSYVIDDSVNKGIVGWIWRCDRMRVLRKLLLKCRIRDILMIGYAYATRKKVLSYWMSH